MIGGSSNRNAIGGDVANINMQKCNKSRIKLSILSISLFAMIMLWNGNDNDDISSLDTTSTSLFQRQLSLLQPFMDPKTTNLRQYPSTLQNLVLDSQDLESLSLDYGTCTNNSIVPENWCLDSHQTPRYVGNEGGKPSSVIQHYTHTGYEKCLAGKTVVLIGDSRVRYQFMHLAGYLASNKKMGCQDQQQTPDPECYLIDHEHQERVKRGDMGNEGWTSWYKKSTAMLQGYDDTTSLCDCYRPTGGEREERVTLNTIHLERDCFCKQSGKTDGFCKQPVTKSLHKRICLQICFSSLQNSFSSLQQSLQ